MDNTDNLARIKEATKGLVLSDAEKRSLAWLCGWERFTVDNIAAVIEKARKAGQADKEKEGTP